MDLTSTKGSSRPKTSASSADAARRLEDVPANAATGSTTDQNLRNAVFMAELMQKLGSVKKEMEVYALFSANQMASATAAPPPTIPEDSTAQPAVPHEDKPQASTRAPDSGFKQSETAPSTSTPEAENKEATGEMAADGGQRDGSESVEPEGQKIGNPNSESSQKGETPVSERVVEGETPVWGYLERKAPVEDFAEGETPVVKSMEGETPVERNVEGETPEEAGDETPKDFRGETLEFVEGETPRDVGGETPESAARESPVYIVGGTPMLENLGETPGKFVGDETPDNTEVHVPIGEGQQLVVDLVDDQEGEEPLVDKRAERRWTRRSLLDEVDDLTHSKKEEFPARGAVGGQEKTPGSGDEAKESRLAKERETGSHNPAEEIEESCLRQGSRGANSPTYWSSLRQGTSRSYS